MRSSGCAPPPGSTVGKEGANELVERRLIAARDGGREHRAHRLAEHGQAAERVFFGATVRYVTVDGNERTVTIVGQDEVDLDRNYISWVSPLARALMKSKEGDRVVLRAPGGVEHLEILEVNYGRIAVDPFREPPGAESARVARP